MINKTNKSNSATRDELMGGQMSSKMGHKKSADNNFLSFRISFVELAVRLADCLNFGSILASLLSISIDC